MENNLNIHLENLDTSKSKIMFDFLKKTKELKESNCIIKIEKENIYFIVLNIDWKKIIETPIFIVKIPIGKESQILFRKNTKEDIEQIIPIEHEAFSTIYKIIKDTDSFIIDFSIPNDLFYILKKFKEYNLNNQVKNIEENGIIQDYYINIKSSESEYINLKLYPYLTKYDEKSINKIIECLENNKKISENKINDFKKGKIKKINDKELINKFNLFSSRFKNKGTKKEAIIYLSETKLKEINIMNYEESNNEIKTHYIAKRNYGLFEYYIIIKEN